MIRSYPKNLSFALVSALALNLALQSTPAAAMETESHNLIQQAPEDISERINYYYENLYKFKNDILLQGSASEFEGENERLIAFKVEAEKGNLKAKVLCYFGMSTEDKGKIGEWAAISEWLLAQENDSSALLWLAHFEAMEWEGHPRNFEAAEKYYLLLAENGDSSVYASLAFMYRYDQDGQPIDIEKAKKYNLLAVENGDTSAYISLGEIYHCCDPVDIEEAEKYYLIVGENGDTYGYSCLGSMYRYGAGDHPADFKKAEEYYLKAVENGDVSEFFSIASMYHNEFWVPSYGPNGTDMEKALYYYRKGAAVEGPDADIPCQSLSSLYKNGWQDHPPELDKALHWCIKTIQLQDVDFGAKSMLRECLFPIELHPIDEELANLPKCIKSPTPLIVIEDKQAEVIVSKEENDWLIGADWLDYLGGKTLWKEGEYQQASMKTNERKLHKPEGQKHYENFAKTFLNAKKFLPIALDEQSFVFMKPTTTVGEHLLSCFKVYDPLNPTPSEEIGLHLYNLCGATVMAFGNENVKLADKIMDILEGEYSLKSLINHHQRKLDLLQRLKTQTALTLDEETLKLECSIFAKPERKCIWGTVGDSKPAFADFLVTTLQNTYGITKEKAMSCIANKRKGIATNLLIDGCLENEITKHIDIKITKRAEKIELLQEIVDSFQELVTVTQPKKVGRFREEYPYLGDMFE